MRLVRADSARWQISEDPRLFGFEILSARFSIDISTCTASPRAASDKSIFSNLLMFTIMFDAHSW